MARMTPWRVALNTTYPLDVTQDQGHNYTIQSTTAFTSVKVPYKRLPTKHGFNLTKTQEIMQSLQ